MMIRESVQVLICLSVLVSTSVSLHMIRDAYHRPLNERNNINRDTVVIDSVINTKRIPNTDLSMRATRMPLSNTLKYHELFPSSMSSSSSVGVSGSSSSSSPSSTLPLSMFRSGSLARSTVTDPDTTRYRWQKQVFSEFIIRFLSDS